MLKKMFMKLWPSKPKELYTSQGRWLRKMALLFMVLDLIFFVISLAVVGFGPMFYDIMLAVLGYSVYLTLREWVVMLYMFGKVGAAFHIMFGTSGQNYSNAPLQSTQIFGKLANSGFHLMSVYFVGRAYYYFRKNGGIWGTSEEGRLAKAAHKTGILLEKAVVVAEKKLDSALKNEEATNKKSMAI